MHNSEILSLFLTWSRKFLLISMLFILLTFINIFYDSTFAAENKTLKYIYEPFLKLNGTDFYDIENNDQLQLEEFTLATWFRTNQSCSCEPSHIVNKGGFNNERPGKNMNYGVWMNTDGTITAGFESQRGKNFEILSQKKFNDGKWHYVVVLYNSTVLRVDIDGNTIGNLKISKTPDTKGNQPLRIGANSLDLDKYFNGEVDEVRIWNRGLAINELIEIYTNRNFTTNGQVEYLNFGKNTINNDKELIYNNSITKSKKEFQTTLGSTKQPQVIFVFVIPKDILQELESGVTKKQQSPLVENKPQTGTNDNSKTNNTNEESLVTLTNKQQPPTTIENQTSSKPITTTNKQQPPTTIENQTSNRNMTKPTLLSNNISNTANVKSDKINLVFENLSVNRSVTNSVEIKGEIKNNTPLDLQEIKISAEYYNKTGTLLAKVEHFITSPSYILKPNQLISFNILEVLGFGFDKLGDYNIFASGESIN
ncbi:MAG TPA: LamG-like jellyroll fold domain-containing protein [Nitrososphaeraceae archaeon]